MKTYTATLEFSVNDYWCPTTLEDVRYDKHVIIYTFWKDDEQIESITKVINKETYDKIKSGEWESDFCSVVRKRKLEHTSIDGDFYHGTWK